MKAKNAAEADTLEKIPNIGKSVANDLRGLGILIPDQLKGMNGIELYFKLNEMTGIRHDPCIADTFMAAIDFMNGGKSKPWWQFTAHRKTLLKDFQLVK
jgi:DNA transformation protein